MASRRNLEWAIGALRPASPPPPLHPQIPEVVIRQNLWSETFRSADFPLLKFFLNRKSAWKWLLPW